MLEATRVLPPSEIDGARIVDAVILDHEQRRNPRGPMVAVRGLRFTVDLADAVTVRGGDAFMLSSGDLVEVVAQAEPLLEVRASGPTDLARIAWALGDRHLPVQIFANRIRLRAHDALEKLLAGLGGRIAAIEAPFDPEGGAYLVDSGHGHDHGHGHHDGCRHDHEAHDDHRHGHDHGCQHDHNHHDHGPRLGPARGADRDGSG